MMKIKLLFSIIPLLGCSLQQDYHPNIDTVKTEETTITQNESNKIDKIKFSQVDKNKQVQKTNLSTQAATNDKALLNVPLIRQNPELKYGCEVTSLTMVLQYAGVNVTKLQLAKELKKDYDQVKKTQNGNITHWGNPQHGFVGDISGKGMGYAVFDQPIFDLMEKYLPERAVNLTNKPFEELLKHVKNGRPVVIWTTGDYRLPDRWESWKHGNETIKTPLDLHAVVLVGYDNQFVYLNDPLSGKKNVKVNKQQFIKSWVALKKRAVSYY